MKIKTVRDPRRNRHGGVNVTVEFEGERGSFPYTVEPGSDLEQKVLEGKFGAISPLPEPITKPYDILRREELAPLDGEGMDAMRKAIIDLMAAANLQPAGEFAAYMDKVNAIKARHPKDGG